MLLAKLRQRGGWVIVRWRWVSRVGRQGGAGPWEARVEQGLRKRLYLDLSTSSAKWAAWSPLGILPSAAHLASKMPAHSALACAQSR